MKWALISGATAGIGMETAKQLAAQGYNILALGRRADRLNKLKTELSKSGREVVTAVVDVQKHSDVDAFAKEHQELLGKLDVLVNNAGLAKGTEKTQDGKINDWDVMIDTNVKGLLYLTRSVIPFMLKNKRGHIVNLGSVAGRWVYPGGAVYCATKFAVRAISEGLRMDLIGSNIRVSNIEPGMVNTEFSLVRLGSQERADSVYANMKPLTAADIAETIGWVLSRPAHVNIQELVIFPTDQPAVGQVHRRT